MEIYSILCGKLLKVDHSDGIHVPSLIVVVHCLVLSLSIHNYSNYYMYNIMCICVCVCVFARVSVCMHTHTHTLLSLLFSVMIIFYLTS